MNSAAGGRGSSGLLWFKSSYSGSEGGDCVEVARRRGGVYVRDSKDSAGLVLTVAPDAWGAFLRFAGQGR
jgi:hypothetical protein